MVMHKSCMGMRGGTPTTGQASTEHPSPAIRVSLSKHDDASGCIAPEGLDVRGLRLWCQLHDQVRDDPAGVVLLEEACRIADRLDGLDRILRGEERHFIRLVCEDPGEYRFYVDAALSEARQQVNTLRQLIAALPKVEASDDDGDAWLAQLPA